MTNKEQLLKTLKDVAMNEIDKLMIEKMCQFHIWMIKKNTDAFGLDELKWDVAGLKEKAKEFLNKKE